MIVEFEELKGTCEFVDIEVGDVFMFNQSVFIRIEETKVIEYGQEGTVNCCILTTGELSYMSPPTKVVKKPDAVLKLENHKDNDKGGSYG